VSATLILLRYVLILDMFVWKYGFSLVGTERLCSSQGRSLTCSDPNATFAASRLVVLAALGVLFLARLRAFSSIMRPGTTRALPVFVAIGSYVPIGLTPQTLRN